MATKKSTAKRVVMKDDTGSSTKPSAKGAGGVPGSGKPHSMPKAGKDPKGGLTAAGRRFFNETEGSHLKPGVQGPADTPEKTVRKGSFLRRHFAHPRGPMKDKKGEPTRLALSAHAWGEPVPNTPADAKKLASKGHELLEKYHALKDGAAKAKVSASAGKGAGRKAPNRPGVNAAKMVPKKAVAKKAIAKRPAAKKTAGKKTAGKKTAPASTGKRGRQG